MPEILTVVSPLSVSDPAPRVIKSPSSRLMAPPLIVRDPSVSVDTALLTVVSVPPEARVTAPPTVPVPVSVPPDKIATVPVALVDPVKFSVPAEIDVPPV